MFGCCQIANDNLYQVPIRGVSDSYSFRKHINYYKKKKWIAVMAPFCGHILVSKPSVFRETLQYILTFYLSFWLSLSSRPCIL